MFTPLESHGILRNPPGIPSESTRAWLEEASNSTYSCSFSADGLTLFRHPFCVENAEDSQSSMSLRAGIWTLRMHRKARSLPTLRICRHIPQERMFMSFLGGALVSYRTWTKYSKQNDKLSVPPVPPNFNVVRFGDGVRVRNNRSILLPVLTVPAQH